MISPLRILYLEDDLKDAELVQAALEGEGISCQITRVETEHEFMDSLQQGETDLILADYTLPSFDGISALKIAKELHPEMPFIFVSGTLGEEVAIEALKMGATDYVFKTRLSRIVPSVQRALLEAHEKNQRKCAEEALRRNEAYLAGAQRLSHTGSFGWQVSTGKIYWSDETFRIFEVEPGTQLTLDMVLRRVHPEDRRRLREVIDSAAQEEKDFDSQHRLLMPDGSIKYVRAIGHPTTKNGSADLEFVGALTDITEQRNAHEALKKAFEEIKALRDQLSKENIALREEVDKTSMFEEIVGDSEVLQSLLVRIAKVAPTDATVLVTGETGTGKELIARAIHKRSQRATRAFVNVNCAAIPTSLIASELFGHEKGAFTGALQRRLGRFELAEGGTIFLDEVGELPLETQVALLRILQEREFERVGGSQTIRADVRVIAATNRDLQAAIASSSFRSDLFYRLNVVPLEVPALRDRKEDIPMLIRHYVDRYARKVGKRIRTIDKKTMELLQSYAWPGNIRELQNVIERSVVICETETLSVEEGWLSLAPSVVRQNETPRQSGRRSVEQERKIIEAALEEAQGKVSGPYGAAAQLGMPASTLESKIRVLRIDKYRYKRI